MLPDFCLRNIAAIQPPSDDLSSDSIGRRWDSKRTFTSKSAYSLLVQHPGDESVLHILRDCNKVRETWSKIIPSSRFDIFFDYSLQHWLKANLCSKTEFGGNDSMWDICFATICWQLWKRRCSLLFDRNYVDRGGLLDHCLYLADLYKGSRRNIREDVSLATPLIRWQAPQEGWIKINTDAAVAGSDRLATIGGVFRDHTRKWIFGFSRKVGVSTVIIAKLWAIHDAFQQAWDRGLRKINLNFEIPKLPTPPLPLPPHCRSYAHPSRQSVRHSPKQAVASRPSQPVPQPATHTHRPQAGENIDEVEMLSSSAESSKEPKKCKVVETPVKGFKNMKTKFIPYTKELWKVGGPPDDEDWDKVTAFLPFIEIFYEATLSFSGSRHKLRYVKWIVRRSYDPSNSFALCHRIKENLTSLFEFYASSQPPASQMKSSSIESSGHGDGGIRKLKGTNLRKDFVNEVELFDTSETTKLDKLVEALICTQDWIRTSHNTIVVEENLLALENMEEEMQDLISEQPTIIIDETNEVPYVTYEEPCP
ncbi:hypothetical protein V6N11_072344 [Hibiscus sabdariffa]|uniref:RNase H type-1 domain-containing protein n=1 Tax=Hibiscus sabdariffa TaxID=183260 RepID=A0ABR2U2Q9_9ROSI